VIEVATIHIWNTLVGAVSWDPGSGLASFEFDPGFSAKGWNLSPLKMPADSARGRIFSFKGLPGMLNKIASATA